MIRRPRSTLRRPAEFCLGGVIDWTTLRHRDRLLVGQRDGDRRDAAGVVKSEAVGSPLLALAGKSPQRKENRMSVGKKRGPARHRQDAAHRVARRPGARRGRGVGPGARTTGRRCRRRSGACVEQPSAAQNFGSFRSAIIERCRVVCWPLPIFHRRASRPPGTVYVRGREAWRSLAHRASALFEPTNRNWQVGRAAY